MVGIHASVTQRKQNTTCCCIVPPMEYVHQAKTKRRSVTLWYMCVLFGDLCEKWLNLTK